MFDVDWSSFLTGAVVGGFIAAIITDLRTEEMEEKAEAWDKHVEDKRGL